jgi:chromate transporter
MDPPVAGSIAVRRPAPHPLEGPSVRRLVTLGLVLGVVGFGGGFAVAQRIRRALVDGKRWIDDDTFVEAFAVASALPGTAATNLLTVLGYRLTGPAGALGAALGFLAPSVALMIAFGAAYEHLRGVAVVASFLDGMSLATVGVVAAVAIDMRRYAIRARLGWVLAAGAAVVLIARLASLLEVIAVAGLVGLVALRPAPAAGANRRSGDGPPSALLRGVLPGLPAFLTIPSAALFLVFARIGVATFGGGFAMIAPIEHEVVHLRGWLGEGAFNDAMVLGQITPGPVAIAATFIGYRVAGLAGAGAATLGMFGPPFLLSLAAARSIARFRESPSVQGFLAGVAPAVVGVIAASSVSLWRTTVRSPPAAALAAAAFILLVVRPKLSPLVPLAAAGLLAWLAHFVEAARVHGG